MNHAYCFWLGLSLSAFAFNAHAQAVGVGTTTPDANAALDISAGANSNKGLLIPRMTQAQRTAVTTTSEGMLVYQTNGTQPGFWYFSSGAWVALPSGQATSSAWQRSGNTGTDPGTNPGVEGNTSPGTDFIGSTDNKDLVFRTGNTERLRITTDGSLYSRSTYGLILNASDAPLITRGWDKFTSGAYAGLGRWGIFMRASSLSSGIPDEGGKTFSWVTWSANSTISKNLMTLTQTGNLGLGTDAPAIRLSIVGTGAANPNATGTTQSGGHIARFRDNGSVSLDLGSSGTNGNWLQSTNPTDLSTNYALKLNPNGGNVGIGLNGTTAPTSTLSVGGAVAIPYVTTGTATSLILDNTHQTVRRLAACTTITVPQASTCPGRLYTIINASNAASNVALNVSTSGNIYDDVTNTNLSSLAAGNRISIQSDGTDWIVIGR
ncbi:hypothetical protein [Hymenobacter defluvii]|uniref:SH3 domain-containing protein n=1 Tax=Hymenobacter defluvii TaxID=2054411 RepID=A0ABS3T8W7_9BACT|nr:hypothetical protein [Hymenobacter defluvii]MBO3270111.1 hypothetical protein [Hymenobacter defluvii]